MKQGIIDKIILARDKIINAMFMTRNKEPFWELAAANNCISEVLQILKNESKTGNMTNYAQNITEKIKKYRLKN